MTENFKAEKYRTLLERMDELCSEMPGIILPKYFDSNKYLYSLYYEAFNSIKGVCMLIGSTLITQAAAILRMAIEQTATIRVLELHKELQAEYENHRRLRFEVRDKESFEKKKIVREHFKNKMDDNDNKKALEYLEYGWLKPINGEYGLNALIQISKIQEQDDAIKNWKDQLNHFVHGNIEFANLASTLDAPVIYSHTLIQIAAKLLDILVVEFHNENDFKFIIDNVNYRELFLEVYKAIL